MRLSRAGSALCVVAVAAAAVAVTGVQPTRPSQERSAIALRCYLLGPNLSYPRRALSCGHPERFTCVLLLPCWYAFRPRLLVLRFSPSPIRPSAPRLPFARCLSLLLEVWLCCRRS